MKVSEIKKIDQNIEIIEDGMFEQLVLVGLDYNHFKKSIAFVGEEKYIEGFLSENIENVICTLSVKDKLDGKYDGGICVSNDPKTTFFKLHNYLASNTEHYGEKFPNKISPNAIIHPTAVIDESNIIIESGAEIGANTEIKKNTIIKSGARIGSNCSIGAPAFYYYGPQDNKKMVICAGTVVFEENSEMHSNGVVESSVFGGKTIIGKNSKLDNNILVGHDSIIGENCIIAGGTTLAGYVTIGSNSFAGVGVTFAPMVTLGESVMISAGAVVTNNVSDNSHVSGNFAIDHKKYLKFIKDINR